MIQCPKCNSEDVHRSRSRSILERLRCHLTAKRPYRCRICGWRNWGLNTGPRFGKKQRKAAAEAIAAAPPNLNSSQLPEQRQPETLFDLRSLDPLEKPAPIHTKLAR
jgi:hypothetical protein